MNKEKFIEMLEQAKEDEYGRLYVLGEYNNKIYFGTITTVCEDIFRDNDSAEIYDRHFWNDDTLECFVVSTKHDEAIEYKEPERIEEIRQLKKQLEEHKNIYIKKVNNFLAEDVEPDPEDLYMAELEQRAMDCELMEMQQKKFIKYLKNKINKIKEQIKNYDIWHEVGTDINFLILKKQFYIEILQKYKEIGDDK